MDFSVLSQPTVQIILAFLFGTALGSFLNVLTWRLPREESILGRSHCPKCNHQLVWHDLIPVLSILLQRGRCKYCKQPVSLRYPLIEVLIGFTFALAIWLFPATDLYSWLFFAKIVVAIVICVTVFIIDLEHYLILDKVVFPGLIFILIASVALDFTIGGYKNTLMSFLGAVVAFVPFWLLWFGSKLFTGKTGKWMGLGDVKFAAFMGAALGVPGIAVALFLSFTIGALVGVSLIFLGKKQLSSRLPFGTFLSLATVIALFWGAELWSLYWSLFTIA